MIATVVRDGNDGVGWWWPRGGDEGEDGVGGSVVGVAFGDDVGGGGRLLDWPEAGRKSPETHRKLREKREARD
ncbi:hypothetical protein Tco_0076210 [Tanacetum coccineum]